MTGITEEQMRQWIQTADGKMRGYEERQAELLAKLATFERVQNEWQANLAGTVRFEIGRVTGSLGELFEKCKNSADAMDQRPEAQSHGGRQWRRQG